MKLPLQHQGRIEMDDYYLNCLTHQNDMFYQALMLKKVIERCLEHIQNYFLFHSICVAQKLYLQL